MNADRSETGIATITSLVSTAATITDLTVTNFTSDGGDTSIGEDISTRNLEVTGVSTFTGISTFKSGVYVNGTLEVESDVAFGSDLSVAAGATVGGALTVTGIATFKDDVYVNGTFGVDGATRIDDNLLVLGGVNIQGVGLTVTGVTTFTGNVFANNNLDVEQLLSATNVTIDDDLRVLRNARVAGVTTFVGLSTFGNDVFVEGDLRVKGDFFVDDISYDTVSGNQLNITGVGTIANFVSTAATIGFVSFTTATGSALTVTDLTYTNIISDGGGTSIGEDISTRNLEVTGVSTFTGISSFQSDVDIDGNLSVGGTSIFEDRAYFTNMEVSGFSTFTNTVEIIGDLEVQGTQNVSEFGAGNFNVSGIGTIFELNVLTTATIPTGILTHTQTETLEVTGLSTFRDDAQFDGNISIGGTVTITGDLVVDDITYDTVSGNQLNITGVGTVANFVSTASTIGIASVGFATITEGYIGIATVGVLDFTDAVGSALTVTDLTYTNLTSNGGGTTIDEDITTRHLDVTGVATVSDYLNVNASARVGGASTFVGVSTFGDNVFVEGNLRVKGDFFVDDITYDTVSGNQLNITGVGTITNLVATASTIGVASFTSLTDTTGETVINDDIITKDLRATGDTTLVGLTTTFNELYVGTDLIVERNLNVAGVATFTGITTTVSDLYVGRHLDAVGIGTFQDINTRSDIRYKENIVQVEDALDKVSQLRGVEFSWKNDGSESGGVIAQEVEQVFPNLVRGEDPKVVNYNGLIGALIEAVKELKTENNELRSRIEKLEG